MLRERRTYIAGHGGLVGSAIVRECDRLGYSDLFLRTRSELDLTDSEACNKFFAENRPEIVILAAARVGGILANDSYPADFIRDNLMIQTNVIDSAYRHGANRLIFLGSSCIYPRLAPQPIREDHFLTGPLEPTNSAYAIAKIAGIEMCRSYRKQYGFETISLMPSNLYGPGDNFDLQTSHVLPALMRKYHEAKVAGNSEVEVWGSGKPLREFLHVDDLAKAVLHLVETDYLQIENAAPDGLLNAGVGDDISIADLARLMAKVVGYQGETIFDRSKPDGTPRKLQDVSRLKSMGWEPKISLRDGLTQTYDWFLKNIGA